MTSISMYLFSGIILFVTGAVYLAIHPKLIGKIMAVNIAGSGVFLVFVAAANRVSNEMPDPVPHAMVLTGIVVAVSATAVALAFVTRLHNSNESDETANQGQQH